MSESDNNGRGAQSVVLFFVFVAIAVWSYFQTRDAIQAEFVSDGSMMYPIVLNGLALLIQLGANPIWSIADTKREDGAHILALALVIVGWAFTAFDALTNIMAWVNSQYGGNILNVFNGSLLSVLIRLGIMLVLCIGAAWAEEMAIMFAADAAKAFGDSGLASRLAKMNPLLGSGKKKKPAAPERPSPPPTYSRN